MRVFRWEEQLRRSFQRHAEPSLWCRAKEPQHILSVNESTCSDGRADWVWANLRSRLPVSLPGTAAALLEQPACSRILAALRFDSPLPADVLRAKSGVTRGTFVRHLDHLLDVELVRDHGLDQFSIGPAFPTPRIEICSFEFKLENWRRAFQQARRYRSFSHRVYVVMPSGAASRALQEIESFHRFNIGLISHDADGTSRRLSLSRKRQPSCPSNLIQAIGLLMRQAVA
ncbi:MAG: helix-turn-helix domain-containing protein [Gemmataceae bacterium]